MGEGRVIKKKIDDGRQICKFSDVMSATSTPRPVSRYIKQLVVSLDTRTCFPLVFFKIFLLLINP